MPQNPSIVTTSFPRMGAIRQGFFLFIENIKHVLILSVFFILLFGIVVGIQFIPELFPPVVVVVAVPLLVFGALTLYLGLLKIMIRIVEKSNFGYGEVIHNWKNSWKLLIAIFMTTVIINFGFLLLIIPGIYLSIRLMFVQDLIADLGVGPIHAIRLSFQYTKGYVINLLLFNVILFFFIAGVAMLFILPFMVIENIIPGTSVLSLISVALLTFAGSWIANFAIIVVYEWLKISHSGDHILSKTPVSGSVPGPQMMNPVERQNMQLSQNPLNKTV